MAVDFSKMALTFPLHAGDAADYEWGSLAARFKPTAKINKNTLVNVCVALASKVGPWKTEPEFRQIIAFMHECVHYQQDIATGVGHWDYLSQRKHQRRLLTIARNLSWTPQFAIPYAKCSASGHDAADTFLSELTTARDELLKDLIFVPTKQIEESRRQTLIEAVRALRDVLLIEENIEDYPFFLETLLESEATACVLAQYLQIDKFASEDGEEIADQNGALYYPSQMASAYSAALMFFRDAMKFPVTSQNPDVTPINLVLALVKLFNFFVDLSCAHPSPRLLNNAGADRLDYDPGLKFMRLVLAFMYFNEEEDKQFMDAVGADDVRTQEALLLAKCEYPYLSSCDIYEDWAKLFSEMIEEKPDAVDSILRIRHQACKLRLSEPGACIKKTIGTIVFQQIPLFVLTPPGFTFHGFNFDQLEPSKQRELFEDLVFNSSNAAIVDYYLEMGNFVCPFAEANMCKAATSVCLSGITKSSEFPPASDCQIRDMLDRGAFNLAS